MMSFFEKVYRCGIAELLSRKLFKFGIKYETWPKRSPAQVDRMPKCYQKIGPAQLPDMGPKIML